MNQPPRKRWMPAGWRWAALFYAAMFGSLVLPWPFPAVPGALAGLWLGWRYRWPWLPVLVGAAVGLVPMLGLVFFGMAQLMFFMGGWMVNRFQATARDAGLNGFSQNDLDEIMERAVKRWGVPGVFAAFAMLIAVCMFFFFAISTPMLGAFMIIGLMAEAAGTATTSSGGVHPFMAMLLCGSSLLVGIWGLLADGFWRLRQWHQLKILPRSKAASAAQGLCELSGTVRLRAEGAAPGEAVFGLHYDNNSKTWVPVQPCPFYLEDESGRIRVDPRGVALRTASVWLYFGQRLLEVVLVKSEDAGSYDARYLRDGDPVYVLGSVETERGESVIRPGAAREPAPLWMRTLGLVHLRPGYSFSDVFYLVNEAEEQAALRMRRDLVITWLLGTFWIICSLMPMLLVEW